MFDGGGNNRLYFLWWVIAIGLVMWFALRATLGFAPGMPEEQAEPWPKAAKSAPSPGRSEEHTSELQSRFDLVCRLLLEKKKRKRRLNISNESQSANEKNLLDRDTV